MTALYNEHDHGAAAWLRELINQRQITEGTVDERSIADLQPEDVSGFRRVHLFAGIGGWELALRIAGWPEDIPVWTGSCPCQPFSAAGKRKGQADERHLWPEMFRLIKSVRPPCVFGEQVSGAIKPGWLDGVFANLEAEGYACGAVVLGAHSAGAPHIRQRIYWVAYDKSQGWQGVQSECKTGKCERSRPGSGGECSDGLAYTTDSMRRQNQQIGGPEGRTSDWRDCAECGAGLEHSQGNGRSERRPEPVGGSVASGCGDERLGDCHNSRLEGRGLLQSERPRELSAGPSSAWSDYRLIHFRDGKTRRIESSIEPLVARVSQGMVPGRDPGIPEDPDSSPEARVMRLKGYGNSIVPQTAAIFIRAVLNTI